MFSRFPGGRGPVSALRRRQTGCHRRLLGLNFFPNPDWRRPASGSPAAAPLPPQDQHQQMPPHVSGILAGLGRLRHPGCLGGR